MLPLSMGNCCLTAPCTWKLLPAPMGKSLVEVRILMATSSTQELHELGGEVTVLVYVNPCTAK